jgi:hypothetical protein
MNKRAKKRIWIAKKNKCDDEKKIYKMMMMMKKNRNHINKKKIEKEIKKWMKKKIKKNVLIVIRSWWCDVLKTKCVFSFSKIYEECSSCFISIRRCLRSFSSIFLRDSKFDIANVAEKTLIRTMKKKKIIVNNWWKKLKEQKSWSKSNERRWKKTF